MRPAMRWLVFLLPLLACTTPEPPVPVPEQEATVGCGVCRYGKPGTVPGCQWAIELGGEVMPALGNVPEQEDPHGPEGMCTMKRKALVAGAIRHRAFYADRFELRPVTPEERSAAGAAAHVH
jgi:hypothetical protein